MQTSTTHVPDNLSCKKWLKGKVLPYSLLSVGPGADPGVHAVSPQVAFKPSIRRLAVITAVTFPAESITAHRPVPNNTAWWQRHMGVNNLPKVATRQRGGWGSNSRPLSHQFDALATRLLCTHLQNYRIIHMNMTAIITSGSAMAEGPRDALVSRNFATTKHPIWKLEFQVYRVALFAWSYV